MNKTRLHFQPPAGDLAHEIKAVPQTRQKNSETICMTDVKSEVKSDSSLPDGYSLVDVPADHNCLFWSAALGLLLPLRHNVQQFNRMYHRLFGATGSIFLRSPAQKEEEKKDSKTGSNISVRAAREHVRAMLLDYDFRRQTPYEYQQGSLVDLVCRVFRHRVVDHLSSTTTEEQKRALCVASGKENWESYLTSMREATTWGSDAEIYTIAVLAQTNIEVYGHGEPHSVRVTESAETGLYLVHVNAGKELSGAKNHYNFGYPTQLLLHTRRDVVLDIKEEKFSQFKKLPSQLIIHILSFLPPRATIALQLTSRYFYGRNPEIHLNRERLFYTRKYSEKGLMLPCNLFGRVWDGVCAGKSLSISGAILFFLCAMPLFVCLLVGLPVSSITCCFIGYFLGILVDVGDSIRVLIKQQLQKQRQLPHSSFFLWPEQKKSRELKISDSKRLQNELVRACENGDLKAVQTSIEKGADPNLPDAEDKQPLSAAIWGMNLEVVSYVQQRMVSPMVWEACKKHNLYYYGRIFIIPKFAPETYTQWIQLLETIRLNALLSTTHLHIAERYYREHPYDDEGITRDHPMLQHTRDFQTWIQMVNQKKSQWMFIHGEILKINKDTENNFQGYREQIQALINRWPVVKHPVRAPDRRLDDERDLTGAAQYHVVDPSEPPRLTFG